MSLLKVKTICNDFADSSNTLYCGQLPRAPACCFVGWSIRLCFPNSALFRSTKQSDHIRGRPGAHAVCGCQGGGGRRLEYFEPRLFRCQVYIVLYVQGVPKKRTFRMLLEPQCTG